MNKQQYAQTPKRKAWLADYRKKNRQRLNAYQAQWVRDNPEKIKATAAKYVRLHPEVNAAKRQKRRAIERNCKSFIISESELANLYNSPCNFCGATKNITIDHCVPLSRGGDHGIGNLQPLCRTCNSRKKDKTIMEFRVYLTPKVTEK